MIIFAFDDSFVQTFPWSGFTTKWFHNAFSNKDLIASLQRSAWIGIAVHSAQSVVLAVLVLTLVL